MVHGKGSFGLIDKHIGCVFSSVGHLCRVIPVLLRYLGSVHLLSTVGISNILLHANRVSCFSFLYRGE